MELESFPPMEARERSYICGLGTARRLHAQPRSWPATLGKSLSLSEPPPLPPRAEVTKTCSTGPLGAFSEHGALCIVPPLASPLSSLGLSLPCPTGLSCPRVQGRPGHLQDQRNSPPWLSPSLPLVWAASELDLGSGWGVGVSFPAEASLSTLETTVCPWPAWAAPVTGLQSRKRSSQAKPFTSNPLTAASLSGPREERSRRQPLHQHPRCSPPARLLQLPHVSRGRGPQDQAPGCAWPRAAPGLGSWPHL